jgi:chemotaxis protein MotB
LNRGQPLEHFRPWVPAFAGTTGFFDTTMPISSRQSRRGSIDIWPGFVDALSQLLMVIIFLLLIFTAAQFTLSAALSGRNAALAKLQHQVDALAQMLALEKTSNEQLVQHAGMLSAQLAGATTERGRLEGKVAGLEGEVAAAKEQLAAAKEQLAAAQQQVAARDARLAQLSGQAQHSAAVLAAAQEVSGAALARIDALNEAIAALRTQLARVAAALDLSEGKVKAQQTEIADLGQKLNLALVNKVEELARYRSEFFGRLREILGNRPGIKIVGDRFVFQSEVLFASGSAELSPDARQALDPVIAALKQIMPEIPPDIDWVLRVDGYTDRRPIDTPEFPSNWALSTARALSVVRYAIDHGIPADRLAAAGFGDTHPLDPGDSPDAYRRDRRIELRLTEP